MLRAAGWSVYASREQAQETANVVGSSTLFDAVGYAARAGGLEGLDPALHYVLVGEELGLPPSAASIPNTIDIAIPILAGGGDQQVPSLPRPRPRGRAAWHQRL